MLCNFSLVALLVVGVVVIASNPPARAAETAWPVPDWEVAAPESQGLSQAGVHKVRDWLKEQGSKTGMIVRHGRIVGEWYFEDANAASQFLVYSTSKSMSSTAVGVAIGQGKLNLDTTVGQMVPDVSPPEKREINVRQLISMTSGVYNDQKFVERSERFYVQPDRSSHGRQAGHEMGLQQHGPRAVEPGDAESHR